MTRKPLPKTQFEIAVNQNTAYSEENGNPNSAITPLPIFKNETNLETVNAFRALEQSEKGADSKQFTVGIADHDEVIFYYFENKIQPYVVHNNQKINVPVVYGTPERWSTVQKTGYYRDVNEKLMCPLIMVKRDSITPMPLTSKIDANLPRNYMGLTQGYTKSNIYSNFDLLNNRKPVKTYQTVVIPDYVSIQYTCVVWTYYVEQMNKVVEAINYAANAYWGDPTKYQFLASIDAFQNSDTVAAGEERTIKTTFTLKLKGYFIPDTVLKDLTAQKQVNTKGKLSISQEATTNNL